MTTKTYPGRWYRVQQRGCTPNGFGCLHMNWPIERQDLSPKKTDTRHVVPKDVLLYAIHRDLEVFGTHKHADGRWRAAGARTTRHRVRRVEGATEREAMQNLCAELKVKLP